MSAARSEFINGEIWPDSDGVHINAHGGGMLFHEGVYYWFGEHKVAGEAGNTSHVGFGVYSSSDLYNWKNEGIALGISDDPASPITDGSVMERPKVIYNAATKTFVMWFHLEFKGQGYDRAMVGIAASTNVTGPYAFVEAINPNAGVWPENVNEDDKRPVEGNLLAKHHERGQDSRDQTLFLDDDGSAYHLHSAEQNATTHISLLSDDYLRPSGRYVRAFPGRSMEAHAICRRKDKYWYIASGCTGWAPNAARSAVADAVFGPWTELGNPCVGEGSELTYGAQSTYLFKVEGREDAYIAMFDLWRPKNAIDGRYLWLPIEFEDGRMTIPYRGRWSLVDL